ncbi:MAG: FHA domain-containing protein [Deltaproteobacteria bacterium]|nr:FHA domain-containing protein [Deltaproteobacteria bacterium]
MKSIDYVGWWAALAAVVLLAIPATSAAQREVHWQLNPQGFPASTTVFVDVQDGPSLRRDLPVGAFAISMDEFAGEQGGWITNTQQSGAGWAGAQVLIMLDRSRSYTKKWNEMKKIARSIVNYMDPARDTVAVASFPAAGGYSESKLDQKFTNSKGQLINAINRVSLPPKDDKTGARICEALSEGIKFFPEQPADKYRVIIFLSGGADKGEGKGDCVQASYAAGLVPFFNIIFKLDKKYDDPRNSHKIENKAHDLAQNTMGRSIFRRSENELKQFVGHMWNRIRSQYFLQVTFPCYRPAPYIEHTTMLKVEGRDTEGIKFKASSHPAPIPEIAALYPQQAYRNHVDDGVVDLTIDGQGFCGQPGQVKAFVGGRQVQLKSQNPRRLVASLNKSVESGAVKVVNRFGQNGESPMDFDIIKPPKGAEASMALVYLVIGVVALVLIAVIIVALRSRKAKAKAGVPTAAPSVPPPAAAAAEPSTAGAVAAAKPPAPASGGAPKTMAISKLTRVWIARKDGTTVELKPGTNLFGREPHCAVQLEITGVSREHAKIDADFNTGAVFAEDLGSTNGTYWGPAGAAETDLQKLTQRKLLTAGDTIWIGGEKLSVFFESAPGGAPQGG